MNKYTKETGKCRAAIKVRGISATSKVKQETNPTNERVRIKKMQNISVRFTELENDSTGNTEISEAGIGEVSGESRVNFADREVLISKEMAGRLFLAH